MVDLGLRLRLPARVTIKVTDWHGYDLSIHADLTDGRYRCAALEMTREDGTEAAPDEVPDLPITSLVKSGVYEVALYYLRDRPVHVRGTPSREQLVTIAKLYKVAVAVGEPPRKTVADAHDISISTAGRWIAMARKADFLTDTDVSGGGRPTRAASGE